MDESPAHLPAAWLEALRFGSRSYPAILLLTLVAALTALGLLGPLYYLFGVGWGAPLFGALLMFGVLLLFKRFFLSSIPAGDPADVDAALLEYLSHSSAQHPEEEITAEMLENALHLKTVRVEDCMAPRPEIVHIDVDSSIDELRQQFIESRLSRIIVSDGGLDNVLGYVHVQQLFENPQNLRNMVMAISFVPESILVSDMLNKFIRNRASIACVVDEYGGISGLITLEDALEQIFGEIDDEHDDEELIERQVGEREFRFAGRLEVDYLNRQYPDLSIPDGDYTTLSGFLVTMAQSIPEQGQELLLDNKRYTIELVSDRKIETVRVEIL